MGRWEGNGAESGTVAQVRSSAQTMMDACRRLLGVGLADGLSAGRERKAGTSDGLLITAMY